MATRRGRACAGTYLVGSLLGLLGWLCWPVAVHAQGQPDIVWQGTHAGYVRYTTFSPDGQQLASGGDDRTHKLWQASDGTLVRSWAQCSGVGCEGAYFGFFSPDGQTLASNGLKFWNVATGTKLRTLTVNGSVAFTPDWNYVTSSVTVSTYPSTTRSFALLRPTDGSTVWSAANMGGGPAAFSPDGQLVAAVGFAGIDIWRVADGSFVRTITGPRSLFAFSRDGQYVVASGGDIGAFRYDDTVELYRVADGALVRTLKATGVVTSVAFSPDGTLMFVSSWDGNANPSTGYDSQVGSIRIYRMSDGALVKTYDQQTGTGAGALSFAPDGTLFSYAHDSSVVVARVPTLPQCTYAITPARVSLPTTGGSASVQVSAPPGCSWRAVSRASWLRIDSGATGTGAGTVNFSTTSGGYGSTGFIVIAEQTLPVQLDPDPCSYSFTTSSLNFPADGGTGFVSVQTSTTGCSWGVMASNDDWLTVNAILGSASGGGTAKFTVAPNNSTAPRSTTLTVAEHSFTITQAGQVFYQISGRVTDAQGNPLVGATVDMTGAQNNESATDDNGYYAFTLPAGGNYTLSPSYPGFAFNPANQSVKNLGSDATLNFSVTPSAPAPLIISEFRLSGAAGSKDEFIELYNNTDYPLTVTSADASAGWALATPDTSGAGANVLCVIPNGTQIPARGHYLVGNDSADGGYSLPVALDQTYQPDIADNTGIALFKTAEPVRMTLAYRLDAVGFNTMSGGTTTLYRQGSGLAPTAATSEQYAYTRRLNAGMPQTTGDNAQDFVLVSTNGTVAGQPVELGAPGPENLSSPVQRNATIKTSLIDPQAGSTAAPNRVRDSTPNGCGGPNCALGTLVIRRKFTNRTGQAVTALRFRIVDVTTLNSPGYGANNGQADLRALDSVNVSVPVSTGGLVSVKGTSVEQPPTQTSGGGLNSALVVALPAPVAANASISVQFTLGVQQSGSFRFLVNVEALTVDPTTVSPNKLNSTSKVNGGR